LLLGIKAVEHQRVPLVIDRLDEDLFHGFPFEREGLIHVADPRRCQSAGAPPLLTRANPPTPLAIAD